MSPSSSPRLTKFKLYTQFNFKARLPRFLKRLIYGSVDWAHHHSRPSLAQNFKARPPEWEKLF